MTYDSLRNFAYSNDRLIKGEIKGIVLSFQGYGELRMRDTDPGDALELAEKGMVYVIPYLNPWCWMNRQSVNYVDEIVEILCNHYQLNRDTVRVVSTGLSMGGLCAIVYCSYAKITPCACVTNCPVCDLVYHFTERSDLPRSLYSAFGEYEGTMEEALKSSSPLHLIDRLPDIPYTVFHCEGDKLVNFEMHSKRFFEKMEKDHQIVLNIVPLRAHCDLSAEMQVEYNAAVTNAVI